MEMSKPEACGEDEQSGMVSFYSKMRETVPVELTKTNSGLEKELGKSFAQLSMDDRSQIAQEVDGTHCMAPVEEETPELLSYSLERLARELDLLSYKKKVGFYESQKFPHTYVNDPAFRLRFLRSQLFDAREAAIRLLWYCDFVLELFGSCALERQVELNNFSSQEKKWLMKGYVQLMPYRDKSGRRVIFQIMDSNILVEHITRLKIYFYMAMIASADTETQKKGVVLVVWPGGPEKDWKQEREGNGRARHLIAQRHDVVPMRLAGYHFCMPDNPIFRLVRSFAVLYSGICGGIKSRMRFHVGGDTELRYKLQGYGIPESFIPVTGTGNIKVKLLRQWIQVREAIESEAMVFGTENIVECPRSNDVLFKPGKKLPHHPGNVLIEELILSKAEEFTTPGSKRSLYRWITIEICSNRKGRFLGWDNDNKWRELKDDAIIIKKISSLCKNVVAKQEKEKTATAFVDSSTNAFANNTSDEHSNHNSSGTKRKRCDDNSMCG